MKKKIFSLVAIVTFLSSCTSSKVTFDLSNGGKPLPADIKIAFLDVQQALPANVEKIGDAKYENLGSPNHCDFDSNLIHAGKLARDNGANLVKVIKNKVPSSGNPCDRTQIEFYYYSGDVTTLQQYHLQAK